jgi:hypothetical protein
MSSVSSGPEWRTIVAKKGGELMSFNAFKLKRARKIIEDAGIEVGDYVRITWRFDGGGLGSGVECEHTGPVNFYDGEWIELKPTTRSPGHLRLPIVALLTGHKVELVDENGTFKSEVIGDPPETNWEEPKRENPFIKKHLQKGST